MKYALLFIIVVILSSDNVSAQSPKAFTFSLGVGTGKFAESYSVFALGSAGISFDRWGLLGNVQVEIDAAQGDGADNPYKTDDGSDICRDSRNGQFAEDRKCDNTDRFFAISADLSYPIGSGLYFGAGLRAGEISTPYAVLHYAPTTSNTQSIQGFAFVGNRILGLGARFVWCINRVHG